jgi:hypothetical protein
VQRADDAEFLSQASFSGIICRLARSRMRATGIRPKSSRMVLLPGATLQQQSPLGIDNAHGNRAMQQTLAMRRQFRGVTCLAVVGIDQDHLFRVVVHFPSPLV